MKYRYAAVSALLTSIFSIYSPDTLSQSRGMYQLDNYVDPRVLGNEIGKCLLESETRIFNDPETTHNQSDEEYNLQSFNCDLVDNGASFGVLSAEVRISQNPTHNQYFIDDNVGSTAIQYNFYKGNTQHTVEAEAFEESESAVIKSVFRYRHSEYLVSATKVNQPDSSSSMMSYDGMRAALGFDIEERNNLDMAYSGVAGIDIRCLDMKDEGELRNIVFGCSLAPETRIELEYIYTHVESGSNEFVTNVDLTVPLYDYGKYGYFELVVSYGFNRTFNHWRFSPVTFGLVYFKDLPFDGTFTASYSPTYRFSSKDFPSENNQSFSLSVNFPIATVFKLN